MKKKEAKERVKKLKEIIDHHRYLYHVLDKQEISQEALDSLKRELFNLEQKYPDLITPDSPSQRIGGKPLEKFKKVPHFTTMLSFQDAFSKEEMRDWEKRMKRFLKREEDFNYFCELKVDGLAIELVYREGKLEQASTRGDGEVGEEVTENIKTIEAIPLRLRPIKEKPSVVVRGEVFITKKEFERLNREREDKGEKVYANPRNIAAGSIRQLDSKIAASRKLDFFSYDLVADLKKEEIISPLGAETHREKHATLRDLGFKTTKEKYCKNLEEVFLFYNKWAKERENLSYEIDGIAVFVDDNQTFNDLGVTGKAPRGGIAFKFSLKQATTLIEDIKVQIGRTGKATPVAYLRPVEVGGVTITRATLHNQDEIERLGVKIGDTVIVGRAGDVIPYIIKVLPEMRTGKEKKFSFPKNCPICKSPLFKKDATKRCLSKKCLAQQKAYFKFFVSKKAFDIEGLGEKVVEKLIEEGLLSSPSDLFNLKEGDILPLEGFEKKSAENLINSIKKRKEISLSRLLFSLGIYQVGEQTAKELADRFKSLEEIKRAKKEELLNIPDIGPVVAKEIYSWFRDKENLDFLNSLEKAGVRIKKEKKGKKLNGKNFLFTGTLESFSREEAKEKVEKEGGKVLSSLSRNIHFLVCGKNPGSKVKKAKEMGVEIIDEKKFLEKL